MVGAFATALRLRASALLFDCSQPEVMGDALAAASAARRRTQAALRLGIYAYAFAPQAEQPLANEGLDPIRDDLTPAGYLAWVESWVRGGADIVGGCCGIGPEHIRAMRRALDPPA